MTDSIHWQEIAFMMLAGWMGWLSLLVFRQGDKIRVMEIQIALRNSQDMADIKEKLSDFERKRDSS